MQIEQKNALTEREIDAAIAHYQRDKQVMQELLDMWEAESQVVTLPPKPDANPAHVPVLAFVTAVGYLGGRLLDLGGASAALCLATVTGAAGMVILWILLRRKSLRPATNAA